MLLFYFIGGAVFLTLAVNVFLAASADGASVFVFITGSVVAAVLATFVVDAAVADVPVQLFVVFLLLLLLCIKMLLYDVAFIAVALAPVVIVSLQALAKEGHRIQQKSIKFYATIRTDGAHQLGTFC